LLIVVKGQGATQYTSLLFLGQLRKSLKKMLDSADLAEALPRAESRAAVCPPKPLGEIILGLRLLFLYFI